MVKYKNKGGYGSLEDLLRNTGNSGNKLEGYISGRKKDSSRGVPNRPAPKTDLDPELNQMLKLAQTDMTPDYDRLKRIAQTEDNFSVLMDAYVQVLKKAAERFKPEKNVRNVRRVFNEEVVPLYASTQIAVAGIFAQVGDFASVQEHLSNVRVRGRIVVTKRFGKENIDITYDPTKEEKERIREIEELSIRTAGPEHIAKLTLEAAYEGNLERTKSYFSPLIRAIEMEGYAIPKKRHIFSGDVHFEEQFEMYNLVNSFCIRMLKVAYQKTFERYAKQAVGYAVDPSLGYFDMDQYLASEGLKIVVKKYADVHKKIHGIFKKMEDLVEEYGFRFAGHVPKEVMVEQVSRFVRNVMGPFREEVEACIGDKKHPYRQAYESVFGDREGQGRIVHGVKPKGITNLMRNDVLERTSRRMRIPIVIEPFHTHITKKYHPLEGRSGVPVVAR